LPGEFWQDSILFLEDCNEDLSKLDRMMLHLKRTGVLGQISALVLGHFSDLTESGQPYGFSLEDIVIEHTEGLDIPVVMDMPFGHATPFYTFPVGALATLNTEDSLFVLSAPAVQDNQDSSPKD
jgi:muramoyltetrapeptide carboxypeptidase